MMILKVPLNNSGGFVLLCMVIGLLVICSAPSAALHINTTAEGLLGEEGCYIGAYLGGNQGANNEKSVNFFHKTQQYPYESQYLDQPDEYGETVSGGIDSIDTGIRTFRADLDAVSAGAGLKQTFFSRYYDMAFYPDNNYGKIIYTESPAPSVWAEKVIQYGGVPVIVFDPYSLVTNGVLDLNATNMKGTPGNIILKDLASNCGNISERYPDAGGRPATILVWFAHEFNTAPIVNPEANDLVESANKAAFRQVFRQAYTILHEYGGDGVQIVWAGNIAHEKADREHYWPGYDDGMNQLPHDYVDWVGMTWYPWEGGPTDLTSFQGFYDFYADERGHPFIFMETSADGWGDPALEAEFKEGQVRYLYNSTTLLAYPNIKGIIWFNVAKGEQKSGSDFTLVTKNFLLPDGQWNNYGESETQAGTVNSTSDPSRAMLPLYPDAVQDSYFIASPGELGGAGGAGAAQAPNASFVADILIGPAPLSVNFTATGEPGIDRLLWDLDNDGVIDNTTRNTTFTYTNPGLYLVSLTGIGEGGAVTNWSYISVYEPLIPAFTAIPRQGYVPMSVQFDDDSAGSPVAWNWSFGDGTFSDNQNPVHEYHAGIYTVTLTVANCFGVNETVTYEDWITVYPEFYASGGGGSASTGQGGITGEESGPESVEAGDGVAVLTLPGGIPAGGLSITPLATVPEVPGSLRFAGYAWECSPSGLTFDPPVVLTLSFTPDQWAALDPGLMTLQWYNPVRGSWEEIAAVIDPNSRTVTASLSHFSVFALFTAEAPDSDGITPVPAETTVTVQVTSTRDVVTTKSTPAPLPLLALAVPIILAMRKKLR